ncbi:hypothetical protein Baya_11563 [Bagarius yarrelli]|uniref:Uncharacterized protein n=1 Tax=Bagarius yarrelli TaxID=175774 RepID=A0A556UZM0_BAGYA|nr:hypothetical protein Baya_11563 [Bagarius yarrelli]
MQKNGHRLGYELSMLFDTIYRHFYDVGRSAPEGVFLFGFVSSVLQLLCTERDTLLGGGFEKLMRRIFKVLAGLTVKHSSFLGRGIKGTEHPSREEFGWIKEAAQEQE